MRKFTITFLIIILFLSVFFAIFKPVPKQSIQPKTEANKSRAEKLITNQPKYSTNPYQDTEKTDFNNLKELTPIDETSTKKEVETKTTLNEMPQIQIQENNQKYNEITKELSQKYNNNLDAEVSEEDVTYFIKKMLTTN